MGSYTSKPRKISKIIYFIIALLILVGLGFFYLAKDHYQIKAINPTSNTTSSSSKPTNSNSSSGSNGGSNTELQTAWKNIINGRQGLVDIAVYNNETGQTIHYSNTSDTFDTASIVKLSILEALLIEDQQADQGITPSQLAEATPMIENSDNDAASDLWEQVGEATAMDNFFKQIGANSTTAGLEDEWGLTQTTALDQLKVVNAFAYPTTLSSSSISTINSLLSQVESDQQWGVSGGVPAEASVELKNGWLPDSETNDPYDDTDDWTINSIGHVKDSNTDYTIAVLTEGDPSEQYGIDTVQDLSTATWNELGQ